MLAGECAGKLKTSQLVEARLRRRQVRCPNAGLMKIGLSTKLFAAVLIPSVLVVAVVSGATRWNFERGFIGYLNGLAAERMDFVVPRLAAAYAQHGNWDFLRDDRRAWFDLLRPVAGQELPVGQPATHPPTPLPSDLTGAALRLGLLDEEEQWVTGIREVSPLAPRRPVRVQGHTVGWLVLLPFQTVADGGDQRFQQGQAEAALGVALLAVLLATGVALWVSRRLAAPLRRLAAATHQLAASRYETRVSIDGDDEVGQLARDFNHLALALERSSALRREFIADISHELRTPLSVLRGEIEAMQDGVRQLDRAGLDSLQAETTQLGKLVDDLYELALSDAGALAYRMEVLDLRPLVERVAERQRRAMEAGGLALEVNLPLEPLPLDADATRLQQLLANLLHNSRRYTDAPGRVRLTARREERYVRIDLEDSAPGVPPEMLPRLFERFFRVEASRNRATGGVGLGLAICRNIVQAHGGEIEATASPLGGVCITVRLPLA
jgi:two-component system sensor histidine kinase BaeS